MAESKEKASEVKAAESKAKPQTREEADKARQTEADEAAKRALGDNKMVYMNYGPMAGNTLSMPAADADQAISEGWARDANAPPPNPEAQEDAQKLLTPEQTQEMIAKAEAGMRKLRGEPEPATDQTTADTADRSKAKRASQASTQGGPATSDGGYKTRASVGQTQSAQAAQGAQAGAQQAGAAPATQAGTQAGAQAGATAAPKAGSTGTGAGGASSGQ